MSNNAKVTNPAQSIVGIGYREFVMSHDDAVRVYTIMTRATLVAERYEKKKDEDGRLVSDYSAPSYYAPQEADEILIKPLRRVLKPEPVQTED